MALSALAKPIRSSSLWLLLCLPLLAQTPAPAANVIDATGAAFAAAPARRVISLAPSLTEEIYVLGADPLLVADTNYCVYPPAAKLKPKVGTMLSPNLETMLALHPDLVVSTEDGNRAQTVAQMRRLGLPVFVVGETRNYADLEANFRLLARLLGRSAAAEATLAQTRQSLAAVRARVRSRPASLSGNVRTFLEIGREPLVSVNRDSFLDEILRDGGAVNIEADNPQRYPRLSDEAVLRANPDAILITDEDAVDPPVLSAWLRFPSLAATRQHRVFLVPSHQFDTPTPMTFAAAVAIVARLLHPEAF